MSVTDEGGAKAKKTCGIIMPISPHPRYDPDHWEHVLKVYKNTINETDFEPKLVSDEKSAGIIHQRIVKNVYENEILICDVSSNNPNVMIELGLRLAFDKPVVLIKDDITEFSFDIAPVAHLQYPRSLRITEINAFKIELKDMILETYKESISEPNYSPYLKSFGRTMVASEIKKSEIPQSEYFLESLERFERKLDGLAHNDKRKYSFYEDLTIPDNRMAVNPHEVKKYLFTYIKTFHPNLKKSEITIDLTNEFSRILHIKFGRSYVPDFIIDIAMDYLGKTSD